LIDGAGGGEGCADEGGEEDAGEAFFFEKVRLKEFIAGQVDAGGTNQRAKAGGDEPDKNADGEGEKELGEAPAFHNSFID